jgi:hypothetical protein
MLWRDHGYRETTEQTQVPRLTILQAPCPWMLHPRKTASVLHGHILAHQGAGARLTYGRGPLETVPADLAAAATPRFRPAGEEPEQVQHPFSHLSVSLSFFPHPVVCTYVYIYII